MMADFFGRRMLARSARFENQMWLTAYFLGKILERTSHFNTFTMPLAKVSEAYSEYMLRPL